ncbi:hypothetical protein KJ853_00850 [Patescibacteria group bacterium]|nr:hypothetical protein [Patescibacteria group bacterium]
MIKKIKIVIKKRQIVLNILSKTINPLLFFIKDRIRRKNNKKIKNKIAPIAKKLVNINNRGAGAKQ